jgi:carbon-monoxide dehydrogenase medium subunit
MTVYVKARSVEEACRLLAEDPDAKAVAGGTAVVLMLRQGLVAPSRLVGLRGLAELRGIRTTDGEVRIGTGATLAEVAFHRDVRTHLPALADACAQVGNVRVRTMATVGGNLCEADYASDPPSVLVSLSAVCEVRSLRGTRILPVAELITGFYSTALADDELITSIRVPAAAGQQRQAYIKFTSRSLEDRPCATVAATAVLDSDGSVNDLKVVVGAIAATPQQLPDVTATAIGAPLDVEVADRVAGAYRERLEPLSDLRGSAWYRRRIVGVLVRRAILQLQDPPASARRERM